MLITGSLEWLMLNWTCTVEIAAGWSCFV